MSKQQIQAIIGLGNPGREYALTRHNAGQHFLEMLGEKHQLTFRTHTKFKGLVSRLEINDHSYHLLIPTTFMNHSGLAVQALATFYKLSPEQLLVVHDDLDLLAGEIRYKFDGGHGGHNGLRDIINRMGSREFHRLRIGIGHPGRKEAVVRYVLEKASTHDQENIQVAQHCGLKQLGSLLRGETAAVMQALHTRSAAE